MNEISITGNLVNAYYICHRKVWLFGHKISPTSHNTNLEIGKLIAEESYIRGKKEIQFGSVKLDLIKEENNTIIVSEIKKSSKGLKAAKMQLLYYLYQLKLKGIFANGRLLIPKEKKKLDISLTDKEEIELLDAISNIEKLIYNKLPPKLNKSSFCKKCAYFEFCWS
jgi:CRISPR-associated exonuclease Cas4